ncbi:hypothetical protein [Hyalangium gracile]|uniref:hypothetical protein n=1 Tax=Hyalangium gracile TaxID=394092 RepID=UPI001CC96CCB|nr:hypothetical protein [Hyalangium gracile]
MRLDTETMSRFRHAAAAGEGTSTLAPAVTRPVASYLAEAAPALLTLLESDNAVGELEERLVECARQAERQVNFPLFGHRSPTREECGQEVEVDGCAEPITRAMLLGQQKHALALECVHQVLEELWPSPFSLEQRYRYYPNARFVETVSRQEEARLIAQGCTRELWRTIKPDIVLHADRNLMKAALILELKFPCPDTNTPRWREYGENSAYANSNQGDIYKEALGGEALIVSPRMGLVP